MGAPQPLHAEPQASALDRIIGWISPRAGLVRYFDRQRLHRAYEAASPRDGWKVRRAGASANTDHMADAGAVRVRARSLVQNVPYVRAGLDALVSNTVGTGIITYSTAPQKARIDALWAAWVKVCDADGRLDYYGMQAAAYRAMEQDGEVLIRLRPRLVSDGLPVPLQLQLLEIDWLDTSRQTGAAGNNQIINGIEYDLFGRVAAYWLWDQHPGELNLMRGLGRTLSKRVPAESIVHLYAPERPGAGRGFSRLSPVIARVRDLQLYEDAELARKNLEARLSVLVSGDVSAMAAPASYGEPANPDQAASTGDLGQLTSGGITSLPPGVNITTVAPQPAPGYVEYVKQQLHLIAAGMGVTYEMLSGDMRDVNFSSARVRLIDFRRQVESVQWLCLVPRLCAPVWQSFIDAAVLSGKLARPDYACDHSMPKWEYVNPEQDAKSELQLISAGLLTISESLRRRGYKPDDVFAEWRQDIEKLRANGMLEIWMALQGKAIAAPAPAPADEAASDQAAAQRAHELMVQLVRELGASRSVPTSFEPQINMPSQQAPIVNVAAAEVRFEPQINVEAPAAPIVNVAAPEVRIEPQITVQPAAVRVEPQITVQPAAVQVTLPRRRIDGMVERDEKGRVLRTTQIETDLPDGAHSVTGS